jgi:hypothetical protein
MREVIIRLKEMFPELDNLTLRCTGLDVRKRMEEIWEKDPDTVIVLDFSEIGLITQGFGDEIVGVFVRRRGIEFVKRNIRVINANGFIRGTLNWVASYSKKMVQNNSLS